MSQRRPKRKGHNMGISPSQYPLSPEHSPGEMIINFDSDEPPYPASAVPGPSAYATQSGPSVYATNNVRKMENVKSEGTIILTGPLDIEGYIKSNGCVTFNGDFSVRDQIESYGHIDMNGHITAQDKIKTMGNLKVYGHLTCNDKIKVYGKLVINGSCHIQGSVEVWGAVTIQGFLSCKSLTVYSSLTTLGDESTYQVAETEKIWGSRIFERE